jgi:hypothetical protein
LVKFSCCLLLALAATAVARAESAPAVTGAAIGESENRNAPSVDIRVLGDDWGSARPADIESVLQSVAQTLLEHFPGRRLQPILVAHSAQHPITLYAKGPNGEYQVYLSATDHKWAQYAYQFAHELSHILTNYEHHAYAAVNHWFEEALCEAAALYALKRLAQTWATSPPYPHWAEYAPQFAKYADGFLDEPHRKLPAHTTLATWFQTYERELRADPHLRSLNEVVANLLLPVFEGIPHFWGAIGYLHVEAKGSDFAEYMQTWHANAPSDYKDIISDVMGWFGLADHRLVGNVSQAPMHESTAEADARLLTPGPETSDF